MSDFDDMFRKGLYDHTVDVPDDLWSRIDQEVNPKKKYYKVVLLSFIALLFIVVSSYLYIASSSSAGIQKETVEIGPTMKAAQEPNDALRAFLIATDDNEAIAETIHSQNVSLRIIENEKVKTTGEIKNKSIILNERLDNQHNSSVLAKPFLVAVGEDKTLSSIDVDESSETKSPQNTESLFLLNDIFDISSFGISPSQLEFAGTISILPEYEKKCPKFGNTKTGYFSIEAYHSSDRNLKKLTAKTQEDESYAKLRSDSESQLYSFSNGLGITWHHTQGIGIGLGVERSQINELFSFVEQDAREVRVLITLDTLFNTDGSYTTSIDTTRIEVLGVKKNYVSNQYTSIDLPISLSYRWDRKRWGVGVRGAVYLNLLFNQKGRVLGLNGKPAWITEGSDNELDAYRAKSGLKFDGSIDVSYHLIHMWDIYVQPFFRYNGNTYTRDSYQLDHFVNTMGLRAGLRYNFGF